MILNDCKFTVENLNTSVQSLTLHLVTEVQKWAKLILLSQTMKKHGMHCI